MNYDAPSKHKTPSKHEVAASKYHPIATKYQPAPSTKHLPAPATKLEGASIPEGHEGAPDLVRDCGEALEAATIGKEE